jgi:DNA-binding NarL/FixJ family response regulator
VTEPGPPAVDAIRIVLADDHPVYRDGLRALIDRSPDLELVGEAASGAEAVSMAAASSPAVVLMDIRMPGMSGIEATRQILEAQPETRILILTMSEDDDSLFAAMRAGARGYLPKDADSEDLVRAIRAVAVGEVIFGESIATRLQAFFKADRARPAASPFPELTDREDEVLELIARGQSNAEIARRLEISDKTVRNHVANVFNKLRVADRSQAIVRAREAGLGREPDPD